MEEAASSTHPAASVGHEGWRVDMRREGAWESITLINRQLSGKEGRRWATTGWDGTGGDGRGGEGRGDTGAARGVEGSVGWGHDPG